MLHYEWDKLKYVGDQATNTDHFTLMDFGAQTHVGVKIANHPGVNSAELKFEEFDPAKKTATYTF